MASKFTKFNTNKRLFDIEGLHIRMEQDAAGREQNVYLKPQDVYEEDGEASPHLVVAIYKNNFSQETIANYPDLPRYRYNILIKMAEDDYAFLQAPLSMNEIFDNIMSNPALIREIKDGNCAISAYHFVKNDEDRYGLEFC